MPRRPSPPRRRERGSGSLVWSPQRNRWRARLPPPDSRESWHRTRDDGAAWIARELTRNREAFDPRRTVSDYLDYWRTLHAHRWGPQTQRRYQYEAATLGYLLGTVPLERLRGDQVQGAVAKALDRGLSRRYVAGMFRLLGRALTDAVKWKLLEQNALDTVTLPAADYRPARAWDLGEVQTVLAALVGHRLEAAYLLVLWAGLRIGEVLALRWSDIRDGVVTVERAEHTAIKGRPIGATKRDREREVDLPAHVADRLAELEREAASVYVLGTASGRRYSVRFVRAEWARLVSGLKVLSITPHGGRRAYGSMLMVAGTPLADISVLLGHSSPATTARSYLASSKSRRKVAAEQLAALIRGETGRVQGQQDA